jgi:hypothetical protein
MAPEESLTVPTILPVSFCAQHKPANSTSRQNRSRGRECVNEGDIANLLGGEDRQGPEALRNPKKYTAISKPFSARTGF